MARNCHTPPNTSEGAVRRRWGVGSNDLWVALGRRGSGTEGDGLLVVSMYRVAGSEAAHETLAHVSEVGLGWLAWEQGRGQG